jgi:RNA polymerase sigma-70 factor (ECF subfamily)
MLQASASGEGMTGAKLLLHDHVPDRMHGTGAPASSTGPRVTPARGSADETALIRRVQAGEREAFDQLVRSHLQRAYAVAYRVMRHREDAEDMVQEGFMAALDNIDRFELGRPFAPWLHRIISNRALSARRSRASRLRDTLPEQQVARGASPLTLALRGEVMERFRATLADLPDRQRIVIELHEVDGFSADEIGDQLGITAGTVRWYIHQARRVLRDALAPLRGPVEDDHDAE